MMFRNNADIHVTNVAADVNKSVANFSKQEDKKLGQV
jgi:hypothetical protein